MRDYGTLTLVRHEFGGDGVAYLRSYLQSNGAFGKRLGPLLARRDLEAGKTWALVPDDSPPHQRTDFESGLFPDASPPMRVKQGYLVQKFDASAHPQVRQAVADLLSKPGPLPRLLCVEWAYARRTAPWPDQEIFFCGDDVYGYQGADPAFEGVEWVPGGATWEPNVGMVTALPPGFEEIPHRQSITPETLEEMAAAAVAIIVGAWDGEAPLFWEPAT